MPARITSLIVNTVGTSLFTLEKELLGPSAKTKARHDTVQVWDLDRVLAGDESGQQMYERDALEELADRERDNQLDKPKRVPAEVCSLARLAPDPETARLAFLATDSAEGIFAGRIAGRFWGRQVRVCPYGEGPGQPERPKHTLDGREAARFASVDLVVVRGLNSETAERFSAAGVANIARSVMGLYEGVIASPPPALVLNVTGGLKGTIPLVTLIGSLLARGERRIELFYLYEDSTVPIRFALPPLVVRNDILGYIKDWVGRPIDQVPWTPEVEPYVAFPRGRGVLTPVGELVQILRDAGSI